MSRFLEYIIFVINKNSMEAQTLVRMAAKVTLTEGQENVLKKLSNSRITQLKYQHRSQIILLCFEGKTNLEISERLGINKATVTKWRRRWHKAQKTLVELESQESGIVYQRSIESLLDDAPRPGAPPKFTAEQVCQILSVACESPVKKDLSFSHWSISSLAQELVDRKIVESISRSKLHTFLKSGEYQTPQSKTVAPHAHRE